jgi:uncharacterized membrane protein HdeD (DUF308 family)
VSKNPGAVAPSDRYWALVLVRAILAAVIALVITFSPDHSPALGLLALGGFAIATGAILVAGTRQLTGERMPRLLFLLQGALLLVGGILALSFSWADLPFLLFLTAALFAATGAVELLAGLRARGTVSAARDWVFVGAAGVVFGVAVLLIPVDYSQAITIPDKVVPNLTASVILVGALGAYAAIVAVYLVIAGLSLKWAPASSTAVSEA